MIWINYQSAAEIALLMNNAANSIGRATEKSYSKASRTTLRVNQKAQGANDDMVEKVKTFERPFMQALADIERGEKEFKISDESMESLWQQLFPPGDNLIENHLTYQRAKNR